MTEEKTCFVISPIGKAGSEVREHADDVYDFIVQPALSAKGYKVSRGDHITRPGKISDQMYSSILDDDLLIAILTYHNPNVFYELAIAHAAAKPLIILCDASHDLPFDIKDQRVIFYDLRPRSLKNDTYMNELIRAIETVEDFEEKPDVPFRPNLTPLGGLGESFKIYDRFLDTISSGAIPLKLIDTAERTLRISGITLLSLINFPDFENLLKKAAERCDSIRILTMHEQNVGLPAMLNSTISNQTEHVRNEILRSQVLWQKLEKQYDCLQYRKVKDGLVYQQLFMTEKEMLYTPYSLEVTTSLSPTLRTGSNSTLYVSQKREFDFLWNSNDLPSSSAQASTRKAATAKKPSPRQ